MASLLRETRRGGGGAGGGRARVGKVGGVPRFRGRNRRHRRRGRGRRSLWWWWWCRNVFFHLQGFSRGVVTG